MAEPVVDAGKQADVESGGSAPIIVLPILPITLSSCDQAEHIHQTISKEWKKTEETRLVLLFLDSA